MKNKIAFILILSLFFFFSMNGIFAEENQAKENSNSIFKIITDFFKSLTGKITGFVISEETPTPPAEIPPENIETPVEVSPIKQTTAQLEITTAPEEAPAEDIENSSEQIETPVGEIPQGITGEIIVNENQTANSNSINKNLEDSVSTSNETSIPAPEIQNVSSTSENDGAGQPPIAELNIQINSFEKITRGNEKEMNVVVTNNGNADAKNIVVKLNLPNGFKIINEISNCGILVPTQSCIYTATLQTSLLASIGKNKIKISTTYEDE
jgi:uncharacterized repeat protein (TIGR01451 family)